MEGNGRTGSLGSGMKKILKKMKPRRPTAVANAAVEPHLSEAHFEVFDPTLTVRCFFFSWC